MPNAGEQGWRSGESTRLPPMWPRFESWRWRHMWVEFVVGSLPCSEGFLRLLRFSPLLKNQHFQIPIRSGTHGHVSTSSYELLSVPWVNKLQITITIPIDMYWLIFFSADRPNDGWNDYHQLKLNTNQESGLKRHFKAALLWARGIFVLGCRTVGSSLVPPDKLQT